MCRQIHIVFRVTIQELVSCCKVSFKTYVCVVKLSGSGLDRMIHKGNPGHRVQGPIVDICFHSAHR